HAPDVWVHLLLTESGLSEEQQLEARDEMRRIIEAWFTKRHHTLSWALDIFFGPGRGCIMDRHGTALEHW
ncbi:MAG TPA: hypothetical protein VNA68_03485, partial [Candidatus Dormibacteraeota bacterium]|nr:hypothetical protein [Candidatus Dormibacteraeota bacterium]